MWGLGWPDICLPQLLSQCGLAPKLAPGCVFKPAASSLIRRQVSKLCAAEGGGRVGEVGEGKEKEKSKRGAGYVPEA